MLISVLKDTGVYVKGNEFFKNNDNSNNIRNYGNNDTNNNNDSNDIQMRSSVTYYNANVDNNNNNDNNYDNNYDYNYDNNNMIYNSPNLALPRQIAETKKYSVYDKEKVKKNKKRVLKK